MGGDQLEGRGCPLLDTLSIACRVSLAPHCQEQVGILHEVLWGIGKGCKF